VCKKILFIDDDDTFRGTVVNGLEKAGYQVAEAANLLEFISAFRSEKPDIVVTDLIIDDFRGTDVRDWLVIESPATPVILVSGTMALLPKEERHGFVGYVRKSLQAVKEILEIIQELHPS
jgi:DNA-binding NtrC family response regulator